MSNCVLSTRRCPSLVLRFVCLLHAVSEQHPPARELCRTQRGTISKALTTTRC